MIKVQSLHIYPIKGMKGSKVSAVKVLQRGFEHDRRYMLIDDQGTFISQRTHPILVFFKPEINDKNLVVNYKDQSFQISLSSSLHNTVTTTIFGNTVQATEVSNEINVWFSAILNQDVRLVKMKEQNVRHKKLIKGPDQVEVSFADGYPYLIIGTASLEKLNAVLEEPIAFDRFRPNLILETKEAHVEDGWENILIGNAPFLVVKPCARCQVITVDQKNGIRSKEPLKTLSTYRKKDNKIYFGANAISRSDSIIHMGDEVVIL